MDRKVYWCPKCGRMFTGAIAFRKHVDSKKCKLKDKLGKWHGEPVVNILAWLEKQVEQEAVPVWSKEDENQYINTIGLVKNANDCAGILDKGTALNWLKSLKGRYTWKPSGEQLNALRVAIGDEQGSDCCGALRDLLKDLKSL